MVLDVLADGYNVYYGARSIKHEVSENNYPLALDGGFAEHFWNSVILFTAMNIPKFNIHAVTLISRILYLDFITSHLVTIDVKSHVLKIQYFCIKVEVT